MYWVRYVLMDQALHGGGMRSTECPSSFWTDMATWNASANENEILVSFTAILIFSPRFKAGNTSLWLWVSNANKNPLRINRHHSALYTLLVCLCSQRNPWLVVQGIQVQIQLTVKLPSSVHCVKLCSPRFHICCPLSPHALSSRPILFYSCLYPPPPPYFLSPCSPLIRKSSVNLLPLVVWLLHECFFFLFFQSKVKAFWVWVGLEWKLHRCVCYKYMDPCSTVL